MSIEIRRDDWRTLRQQIVDGFASAIESGVLLPGERLPSTRTVAEGLKVSRGVVLLAYELLMARGYITGKEGSGTFVARRVQARQAPSADPVAPAATVDLVPGRCVMRGFPLVTWRSAWRQASHSPPRHTAPNLGLPGLRQAIRRRVEFTRGHPQGYQTAVCATLKDSLRVVLDALAPGAAVAVAQPMPLSLCRALAATGRPLLPFDAEDTASPAVPEEAGAIVVLTESRYLTSRTASDAWRDGLTAWHHRTGGAVVEVNLDGATRPANAHIPSLLAHVPAPHAGLVGDFTALLSTEMPLSYMVVPSSAAPLVESQIVIRDLRPTALHQQVLQRMLADGSVRRRAATLARLNEHAATLAGEAFAGTPYAAVSPPAFDGAFAVRLPAEIPAARAVPPAKAAGVRVSTFAGHGFGPPRDNGLVLHVNHLDDDDARAALHTVAGVCRDLARVAGTAAPAA
ncbi:GntR family transcriptional regulator [Sphaerisporangium sp. B11E5]|uniref:GntR family transcriptional regulator n=1 Tax=Sphaerisporangium sp. B11E5 TaxID=3153563 RepID=UPI00325F856F